MHQQTKARQYLDRLDQILASTAREPTQVVDLTDLFGWFSFDTMSDWTMSKSFGMLEEEKWHHIVIGMRKARAMLGPISPAPWLFQIAMHLLPRVGLIKGWYDMVAWCSTQFRTRLGDGEESSPDVPDLTHYLLERPGLKDKDSMRRWLEGDALVAIVAGRYVSWSGSVLLKMTGRSNMSILPASPLQALFPAFSPN